VSCFQNAKRKTGKDALLVELMTQLKKFRAEGEKSNDGEEKRCLILLEKVKKGEKCAKKDLIVALGELVSNVLK